MKIKKTYLTLIILINYFYYSLQGDEKPAVKINLSPPEENSADVIDSLKDLDKMESELLTSLNDDFEKEKKKIVASQKGRIHDIVKGAFIALHNLIPNPVKNNLRNKMSNNTGQADVSINTKETTAAIDSENTQNKIKDLASGGNYGMAENIFKQVDIEENSRFNKMKNFRNLKKNSNFLEDSGEADAVRIFNEYSSNVENTSSDMVDFNNQIVRKPLM